MTTHFLFYLTCICLALGVGAGVIHASIAWKSFAPTHWTKNTYLRRMRMRALKNAVLEAVAVAVAIWILVALLGMPWWL